MNDSSSWEYVDTIASGGFNYSPDQFGKWYYMDDVNGQYVECNDESHHPTTKHDHASKQSEQIKWD